MSAPPMHIGIMQGRLGPPEGGRFQSFPRDGWEAEFHAAREAGLGSIEWIYDEYGADVNPIATDAGVARIKALIAKTGVQVRSICADYFMDHPFLRIEAEAREELLGKLFWLMRRGQLLGVGRMVIPFVDASAIQSAAETDIVVDLLELAAPVAEETGVELHLETALGPEEFAALLARLPHPMIKANYDSGNSSGIGYRPQDEFAAYGERVGSVHIKDRELGNGTKPLGEGSADLPALVRELERVGYTGDFILQVARDVDGDEVAWARKNVAYVEALFGRPAETIEGDL